MAQTVEPIEAVVVSGPRRGEIIQLPEEAIAEVSDEIITMFNETLDELIAVIDRVSVEVRATTEALREKAAIA